MKRTLFFTAVIFAALSLTACAKLFNSSNPDVNNLKRTLGITVTDPDPEPEENTKQIVDMGELFIQSYDDEIYYDSLEKLDIDGGHIYRWYFDASSDYEYSITLMDSENWPERFSANAKVYIRTEEAPTSPVVASLDGEWTSVSFPNARDDKRYYVFVESSDGSSGTTGIMIMKKYIYIQSISVYDFKPDNNPYNSNKSTFYIDSGESINYEFHVDPGWRYYIIWEDNSTNSSYNYIDGYFNVQNASGAHACFGDDSDTYTFLADEDGEAVISIGNASSSRGQISIGIAKIEELPVYTGEDGEYTSYYFSSVYNDYFIPEKNYSIPVKDGKEYTVNVNTDAYSEYTYICLYDDYGNEIKDTLAGEVTFIASSNWQYYLKIFTHYSDYTVSVKVTTTE